MDSTGLENNTSTVIQEGNLMLHNWQEQEINFIENLSICRKRPTRDSVHDLRVAIKRMRSYFRLKEIFNKQDPVANEWKESFHQVSLLFKSLGMLRDFDMSLVLLREFQKKEQKSLPAFQNFLTANRSLARQWARDASAGFNDEDIYRLKEMFNQSLEEYSDELLFEKVKTTAEMKFRKVNKLATGFKKNAHAIRKELKDVFYWLKIFPAEISESFVPIKPLDKILENLGSWQDQLIFREKLKNFKKEFTPKAKADADTLKLLNENSIALQEQFLVKAKSLWKEIRK
jgi:CHAD domain-containing protein